MPVDFPTFIRFLRNNSGLKLLALLLAIASWYGIRKITSNETLIKDVPLHITVDKGWAVLDQSVSDVDVLFSGTLVDLRNIDRNDIKLDLDRQGRTESGTTIVALTPKLVKGTGSARPIRIDPSEVRIIVDRESEKEVPVKADIVGSPPEGIEVSSIVCTPATAVISGPQQRLAEIDRVLSQPIDLEGRIVSFQLTKPILAPGGTWTARINPPSVRVEVNLVERMARRELTNVPVRALLPPDQLAAADFTPDRVAVTLEGPADQLKSIDGSQIVAFADCATLNGAKTGDVPVRVSAGPGFRSVFVTPPAVHARISVPEAAP